MSSLLGFREWGRGLAEASHLWKGNRACGSQRQLGADRGTPPPPPPLSALVSSSLCASQAPFEVGMAMSIPRGLRAQGGKGASQVHRAGNGEVGSSP